MSKVKKIITGIIEGGAEAVKDSAKQIAETVSPVKMLEQALGTAPPAQEDEFAKYLKNLGGELTPQEMEKKRAEFAARENSEMDEARKVIKSALPDHLKPPPGPPKPSVYDQLNQEEEQKKALAVEAQRKQKHSIAAPAGKQARGSLFAKKKRRASSDFEIGKNIKVG